MNRDEARRRIEGAFSEWLTARHIAAAGVTPLEAFDFYAFLQVYRPDMLDFAAPGDRWQVVKEWLRDDHMIG